MPSSPQPDPYEVLGVAPDADAEAVRRAYRRLMRTVHPDHGGTAGMFRTVQAAFDALQGGAPQPASPSSPPEGSARTPPRPNSAWDRARQHAEYERAERERVDEELKRRRRQAYIDHPDDPWLAEFEARFGEEDRASPLSDEVLMDRLEEMMRRDLKHAVYPVPEYWANNMANTGLVSRHQDELRARVRQRQEERRRAEDAEKAEQMRRTRAALVDELEGRMGPGFVGAAAVRQRLLQLRMFRGPEAALVSTLRLASLCKEIERLRIPTAFVGIGLPALLWATLIIDIALVSTTNGKLGSESLAFNLLPLALLLGWVPPLFAYLVHANRVRTRLRRAAENDPFRGAERDREQWVDCADMVRRWHGQPRPRTPS